MAREESDREDLLREATAFVERIELVPTGADPSAIGDAHASDQGGVPIVVGFRASGAVSFFFGADPVYQFNAKGELRRAYCDGLMVKAVDRRLVSLQRVRTANQVELRRADLAMDEQETFLRRVRARLDNLSSLLADNKLTIVGQVPRACNVLGRVKKWLAECRVITVATAPNV